MALININITNRLIDDQKDGKRKKINRGILVIMIIQLRYGSLSFIYMVIRFLLETIDIFIV